MGYRAYLFLFLLLLPVEPSLAQKALVEGFINYKVKLVSAGGKVFDGTYTFTFKGGQLRKDLKLANGYQHVIIINSTANTVYSLQSRGGKKYAIELSMEDLIRKQEKYTGFTIAHEEVRPDNIASCATYKGSITYKDGAAFDVCYTKDWYPALPITYGRFPDVHFMPLMFSLDEDGVTMHFNAEKIEAGPVENANFRIPPDYTMISYKEYKKMQGEPQVEIKN
ncbi:MAG: hypothetical protein K0Q79_3463 [Flavipsychrobacter sp.]|jgi:hypothetical protein|nr:hypothetical protein [Flavipsychrobacter sp.]